MNQLITILVDSDVFVAFVKKNDFNHNQAKELFKKLKDKKVVFVTSNYIFSEVVTVLSQRVNHKIAIAFIENIKSSRSFILTKWVDENLEELAIDIFKQQTSKNVSFVDCTNMALMDYYNVGAIFSFDSIYHKRGFKTVEEL